MATLNETDLNKMVVDFFAHADQSAPLVGFLPIIGEDFFGFWTPDCQFHGQAGFEELYRSLTNNQFDREHTISNIKITLAGDAATITFHVHLRAKIWHAPLPKSLLVENEADFEWIVKPSPKTGTPVITSYKLLKVYYPPQSVLMRAEDIFKYPAFMYGPFTFPPA